MIIAVDGPAAAGKGTLARALARRYNFHFLDTGALYRMVGLAVLKAGKDPKDEAAALAAARGLKPDLMHEQDLRAEDVAAAASIVAANLKVREALLGFQRQFAQRQPGAVLDGRDIGTVVAPEADAKLYVTASPEVRAQRRVRELLERGLPAHYEDVLTDIRARDERDMSRDAAPLRKADDADLLDTTDLAIDDAVAEAIRLVEERLKARKK